jgi:hypothetical protein
MWRAVLAFSSVVLGVAAGCPPARAQDAYPSRPRRRGSARSPTFQPPPRPECPASSGEELIPQYVAALIPVEIGRYRALLAAK